MFLVVLDLDQARNLTFEEDKLNNQTGIIHFERPRGIYDAVNITCYARDVSCSNRSVNVTNSTESCPNCTSITLEPIIRGIRYECKAETTKDNFFPVSSEESSFNTSIAYL